MSFKICMMTVVMTFLGSFAVAHGEDQAGPHGGFIRMPGAFHVEVRHEAASSRLYVYLLDMEWKNPTIVNSTLSAKLKKKGKVQQLKCQPAQFFFECQLPQGENLSKGQLEILAKREMQQGNVAVYQLPLKFETSDAKTDEHSGHHK
ncbi:MAG: hypothetical protein ACK5Y2_04425 [Bdellovibrionales bacterium]